MGEIYYFDEQADEMKLLGELNDVEFLEAAEEISAEADLRVWESLAPFEATISGTIDLDTESALRFRLLFKDWRGIVPRKIGVWA